MVKGVNKTVIEVNDTGSRIFEKIVFYISPKYSGLSPKDFKNAVLQFSSSGNFENAYPIKRELLRNKYKRKRIKRMVFFTALTLVISSASLILILTL